MAFTREALDAVGGFAAFADRLADDYELGNRIAAAGHEIALLPYVVDTMLDAVTLHDVWRHQIRWARTYRAVQPLGWLLAVVTHATTWSALFWLATAGGPSGPTAQRMLAAALGCRFFALGVLFFLTRDRETPRFLWLSPLADLAASAVWLVSWLGRDVEWSGRRFRIERDGRLTPLSPAEAVVPSARSCPEPRPAAGARRQDSHLGSSPEG
jgi:ceramide glucosyltransferase